MGRRQNRRLSHSIPVRLSGTDADGKPFVRLAHTLDISAGGVRVDGVYLALRVGNVVGLQHGTDKRYYRVVWTGKMGSRTAGQIGLQALDPANCIWGFDLPVGGTDDYKPKSDWTERRKHYRFECDLGAELRTSPDAPATLMRCTDISRGGCYLETWSPLPIGTKVDLIVKLPTGDLRTTGEVRTTDPAFGMGIRFNNVATTAIFDKFIQELHLRLNGSVSQSSVPDHTPVPHVRAANVGISHTVPAELASTPQPEPRVLLAEDSRFLRSAYALYLRRANFEVITADDGLQALSLATTEHPDVIVLDLLMPRMDGVGTLKTLKDDPRTATIPVIVLSGLPSSNESKLLENGAFAYLPKTQIGPEDLPTYVKRALASIHQDSLGPVKQSTLVPRSSLVSA